MSAAGGALGSIVIGAQANIRLTAVLAAIRETVCQAKALDREAFPDCRWPYRAAGCVL